jgi:hypothetical protein
MQEAQPAELRRTSAVEQRSWHSRHVLIVDPIMREIAGGERRYVLVENQTLRQCT